ncbi:RiPP maturation radical SAM C-methyltransferase [Anabaena sp. CCY 9910]|uniref:RiPP maturation radical SAM C-methyltransferase n=1 Tax=Anabaena sp. CCY 9910 TaxID=3103870 RepID=UPI0039E06AC0
MVDVCLVSMPYAAIERPSIALGILKSCLTQKGIQAIALYPNISFAEEIGLYKYAEISESSPHLLMGEWTFSGVAFPDFQPDHSEYLSILTAQRNPTKTQALWLVRNQAKAFIERVAQSILDLQPRIVSCSSMFQQHSASLALLRRIKELNQDVITLIGGANCEGSMGVTTHREFPWVDFVASGEGDDLFSKLCRKLLDKGREVDVAELPYGVIGPAHRSMNILAQEAPRASIHDLDQVPTPDYDDYFQTLNISKLSPYITPGLPIETSRGCWWGQKNHCTFCGLNGAGLTYRSKSSNRVVEEFLQLSQRYDLRKFQVVDNILSMNHINTVLPIFAQLKEPYTIFYETKANLKRQQLQQLRDAGVRLIQPGIESMHDLALKLLNKGNSTVINIQLLKWAYEFGLIVLWNFLVGAPGESAEWYSELLQWLPWIVHLQPPSGVASIRYDRFSLYHNQPTNYGLELLPHKAYSYIYPISPEAMADLAYYFEDHSHQAGKKVLPEHQALAEWVNQWTEMFNSPNPPSLKIAEDNGEQIRIIDTRPCAMNNEINLQGLAYQVYTACDRAVTETELLETLHTSYKLDVSWNEIQPVVNELQSYKILLQINGKMLSLAVTASTPYPRQYKDIESPSGYVDIIGFIRNNTKKLESPRPAWATLWM